MVILNFKDGSSRKLDLREKADRDELNRIGGTPTAVATVTGVWVNSDKFSVTLPMPQRFRRVSFYGELVIHPKGGERGEKVVLQADDIQQAVTLYYGEAPKMTRIDLTKMGKQIFRPERSEA